MNARSERILVAADTGLDPSSLTLGKITSRNVEVISGSEIKTKVHRTWIRRHGAVVASHVGKPIGAIETNGFNYLLMASKRAITPVRI